MCFTRLPIHSAVHFAHPRHRDSEQYKYAYCATLLFSIVLRFGVIDEISKNLFANPFSEDGSERALQCVTVSLLVVGALLLSMHPEVITAGG